MKRFYFPTQLYSGAGCIEKLFSFLHAGQKVLLITDENLLRTEASSCVQELITQAGAMVTIFSDVMPNPELHMVCHVAELCRSVQASAVISLGGGSVMDTGKVVAMLATQPEPIEPFATGAALPTRAPLPHYAIPTTCGTGAEASSVAVISHQNRKYGLWAESLYATAAFADPDLLATLPVRILTETAMDALSHALESYIGKDRQAILQALGLEAARVIITSLPAARNEDAAAKARLCEAASMAGIAMGQSGTGIVHSMSDQLGEQFHLSHGRGIAYLLPLCLRYNLPAATSQLARVADAIGAAEMGQSEEEKAEAAVAAVEKLCADCGFSAPIAGRAASDAQIDAMSEATVRSFITDNNPRVAEKKAISDIFRTLIPERTE